MKNAEVWMNVLIRVQYNELYEDAVEAAHKAIRNGDGEIKTVNSGEVEKDELIRECA